MPSSPYRSPKFEVGVSQTPVSAYDFSDTGIAHANSDGPNLEGRDYRCTLHRNLQGNYSTLPPTSDTHSSQVALQFSTRFWEHYSKPIFGGCSTASDIPGIGKICYPSYRLNSTGPGVMLASYTDGEFGLRFASLTTEEHVQYVLDAMIEIHGEVARTQYTGKSARKCWVMDPLESASWVTPSIGMHELYIPAYFKTENKVSRTVWVGEPELTEIDDLCGRAYKVSYFPKVI